MKYPLQNFAPSDIINLAHWLQHSTEQTQHAAWKTGFVTQIMNALHDAGFTNPVAASLYGQLNAEFPNWGDYDASGNYTGDVANENGHTA